MFVKNMGTADRAIRLLAVVGIALAWFFGQITGVVAIVLGVVATAFFVTSLIGICPGYLPLGICTIPKKAPVPNLENK